MKKRYFIGIGLLILVVFITALIFTIIGDIRAIEIASKNDKAWLTSVMIVEIVAFVIIGPALGLLFISHATHVEELQSLRYRVAALEFSNKKVDPKKPSKQDSKKLAKEEDNDEQSKNKRACRFKRLEQIKIVKIKPLFRGNCQGTKPVNDVYNIHFVDIMVNNK